MYIQQQRNVLPMNVILLLVVIVVLLSVLSVNGWTMITTSTGSMTGSSSCSSFCNLQQVKQQQRQQYTTCSLLSHRTRTLSTTISSSSLSSTSDNSNSISTATKTTTTSNNNNNNKATLTDETEWKMRLVLRNVPIMDDSNNNNNNDSNDNDTNTKTINAIFSVQGKFIEEDGYEPPQGMFVPSSGTTGTTGTTTAGKTGATNTLLTSTDGKSQIQFINCRYILSEDPNDRKDGLWVWGLFKEPLYPFLLLSIETSTIQLIDSNTSTTTNTASTSISSNTEMNTNNNFKLYIQMNHRRDKVKGVLLEDGAEIKIRKYESFAADIIGLTDVNVYDELVVGTISIQRI